MSEDKVYCGSGKTFGQYGQIGIDICYEDIPKEYWKKGKNGKHYIKLNVCAKREQDQYGNTHYVAVNTWKPDGGQQSNNQQASSAGNMNTNDFAQEGFSEVDPDQPF